MLGWLCWIVVDTVQGIVADVVVSTITGMRVNDWLYNTT